MIHQDGNIISEILDSAFVFLSRPDFRCFIFLNEARTSTLRSPVARHQEVLEIIFRAPGVANDFVAPTLELGQGQSQLNHINHGMGRTSAASHPYCFSLASALDFIIWSPLKARAFKAAYFPRLLISDY